MFITLSLVEAVVMIDLLLLGRANWRPLISVYKQYTNETLPGDPKERDDAVAVGEEGAAAATVEISAAAPAATEIGLGSIVSLFFTVDGSAERVFIGTAKVFSKFFQFSAVFPCSFQMKICRKYGNFFNALFHLIY